jgi:hypothetical protein
VEEEQKGAENIRDRLVRTMRAAFGVNVGGVVRVEVVIAAEVVGLGCGSKGDIVRRARILRDHRDAERGVM